jgi:Fasciclin domain.
MMNLKQIIIGVLIFVVFYSCRRDWNDHYSSNIKTVNGSVWDDVQKDGNLSQFVKYVKQYRLDTMFLKNDNVFTLFVPSNKAFTNYTGDSASTVILLEYIIAKYYIQSENIDGKRKIQTVGKKFPLFERYGSSMYFDGISLKFESPLYKNGKYYIMDTIPYPKLNLYEYFARTNTVLKAFIDSRDTTLVDPERSTPIGYDSKGNVIYDTVPIKYNFFEAEYFPVSKESRYNTATFVFPKSGDYNKSLDSVALMLNKQGSPYSTYSDIPIGWQNKILIPYLLKYGVFENMLEPSEFVRTKDTLKLKNILGDSVVINYSIGQKTLCSNGYAYNYQNFRVPDTVWNGTVRFEGENLVKVTGQNTYDWVSGVNVSSTQTVSPIKGYFPGKTSNDSALLVRIPSNYKGEYSIEFNFGYLLPRNYLMVIRTNYTYGGIFDIYVNNVKVIADFNYQSKNKYPAGVQFLSVTGKKYPSYFSKSLQLTSWVCFDQYITLTEYGKCNIKIVYKGKCATSIINPAISLDYIDFRPYW